MIISGGHDLVEKVVFRTDTAGGSVITLLFPVWHTKTCFLMTNQVLLIRTYLQAVK